MSIRLKKKGFYQMVEKANNSGLNYDLSMTSNSRYLNYNGSKFFYSKNEISKTDLGFIVKVKKEVFKKLQDIDVPTGLFCKGVALWGDDGIYNDYIEIDINRAYWEVAYQMGCVSEKTYLSGLNEDNVSKKARLVSIGSVASKKIVYTVNSGRILEKKRVYNKKGVDFFSAVSFHVDLVMRSIIDKIGNENCLGYWVDAIFIKKEKANEVIELFNSYGLRVKKKTLSSVLIRTSGYKRYMYMTEIRGRGVDKTDIRIKPFFIGYTVDADKAKEIEAIDIIKGYCN